VPAAKPLSVLDERLRGTRFVSLAPQRVLNPPSQTGMDFWSLNPYVGCEFGCSYCYARYAHRYVVERAHRAGKLTDAELADYRGPHGWEAFERRIFVKERILGALETDLRRLPPGQTVVIGTATDPYQPAERRFRITRAVLGRLASCEGLSVGIITKSPLVARDVDVLRRLQERNALEVYVSLITVDAELVRTLEARSPLPAVRLRGLAKLTSAGINAGLIVAPVLPGITDDRCGSIPRSESGSCPCWTNTFLRWRPATAPPMPAAARLQGLTRARSAAASGAYKRASASQSTMGWWIATEAGCRYCRRSCRSAGVRARSW